MKKLFIVILCGLFSVIVSPVQAKDSIYTYEGMMRGTTIKPVQKYKVKYSGNSAYMSMYTNTECEYNYLRFAVSESTQKDSPGAPVKNDPMVYLNKNSDDFCTGSYSYGDAEIEVSTFNINNKLDSAYAQGTGTLYTWEYEGWDDTTPDLIVEPISIEVTWTGIGELAKGNYKYREIYGNSSYTANSTGSYRNAQARGSLRGDMTAMELVSTYADLGKYSEGYMIMEKLKK